MAQKYFLNQEQKQSDSNIDYNQELNPEQQEVVFNGEGPCLVIAGPGSGKTRTLIYRLAYLLEQGVSEQQILLMTFTKKAAEEMVKRTQGLTGRNPHQLWAGTFHHIGNLVLRKNADLLDYNSDYTILDSADSLSLIKNIIEDSIVDNEQYFPKSKLIKAVFDRTDNTDLDLEQAIDKFFPFIRENAADFEQLLNQIQRVKDHYQGKKQNQNLMDFNDLLLNWRLLLKEYPEVRESLDQRFKYVLVDEFQDTSPVQGDIICLLCQNIDNVLVVADDAQSIYSFRGATIDNIFRFRERFDPELFKLETNYRSTGSVLKIANQSIRHNRKRFEKKLRPEKKEGKRPVLVPLVDTEQQAQFVTQRVLELNREGVDLSDIGILYRSHFHSGELELEMARKGIPYIIRSGIKFHERKHIKDILSFYRVLLNPGDELSWRRLLRLQPGVGNVYSARIYSEIANHNELEEILNLNLTGISSKAQRGWARLRGTFKEIVPLWKDKPDGYLKKITEAILEQWYQNYLTSTFENADQRLEDIEHLSLLMGRYQKVEQFLSDVSLSESFSARRSKGYQEGYQDSVVLSTVHQAKGLEWHTVFIIGLIEGWFPHWKSNNSKQELEEERRIFYVAVTRTKEQLYLTFPITTKSYRRAGTNLSTVSSFIRELDENLYQQWEIEISDQSRNQEKIIEL